MVCEPISVIKDEKFWYAGANFINKRRKISEMCKQVKVNELQKIEISYRWKLQNWFTVENWFKFMRFVRYIMALIKNESTCLISQITSCIWNSTSKIS